ncbi:hypothetical protein Plim_0538 [Planctopirus limnophila DSM 3776]|uniref:Uncharacterized protein n=1 Tax=Planctopirus limnophila (strain ATCC 43296 / DSM 3776 / IFAM 1008 / Mu 290) TaxID=521674 RepID=D5SQD4_PLAL2|nr:hypothetical protein Plim_0538 [Planctopirus limnophila DSM 3776]
MTSESLLRMIIFLNVGSVLAEACFADPPAPAVVPAGEDSVAAFIKIDILARQTCTGLGACQGAALHDHGSGRLPRNE